MNIICVNDCKEVGRKAASVIAEQLKTKRDTVLGLATGSSPVETYKNLIEMCDRKEITFRNVTTVNLDEYKGLDGTHEQSYRHFMMQNLFAHIDIRPSNIHLPNGVAEDCDKECGSYDELIRSLGGIDMQLVGIGMDGHVGFNEPANVFVPGTHVVDLDESTIEANKRFFGGDASLVPKQALTMGIEAIMNAKKVVMVVNGPEKAYIIRQAFAGDVTPQVQASILRFHPDFTLIGDKEALSLLI